MAVEDPPFVLQSDAHPSAVFRHMVHALMGAPVATYVPSTTITSAGGGHGVAGATDLAVTANGSPNMSVNVASGLAIIRGSEAAGQGTYTFFNDATVNMAIAAADGSNPRDDIVVAQVRDAAFSGANNDARLFVVQGTPAASPADPTLPVNCIALARVRVGTGVTSIVGGNITDLRRRTRALGGIGICTSTTRPTGAALFEGLEMWETDLKRVIKYDGTGWLVWDTAWVAYSPTLTNLTLGNGTRTAHRLRRGKMCQVRFSFLLGSTSAVGTAPEFALPFTAVDTQGGGAVEFWGMGNLGDAGVANNFCVCRPNGGLTGVLMQYLNAASTALVTASITATAPFTWGTSDRIDVNQLEFEMADPYQV